HLNKMLFPDGLRTAMLALHPTSDRMPESSLSQMISWCIEEFGSGLAMSAATRSSIDISAAIGFLRQTAADGVAVSILATTAAIAALSTAMETANITVELPAASRLMDTGGPKGQAVPLGAAQVVDLAAARLGIAPEMVINEYGMTEMCSQLYDATAFNSMHH